MTGRAALKLTGLRPRLMVAIRTLARRAAAALALPLAFAHVPAAQAQAISPDRQSTATAVISRPATLRKLKELDFAYLSVTTAGSAIIDPDSDTMTTTGGVLHVGGTPFAALFEAVSPVRAVVIIRIPRQPITLTRVDGTETMTVSDWTMSGNSRRTLAEQEPFDFRVGGTLNVAAGQAEGTYVGTFEVTVQYP